MSRFSSMFQKVSYDKEDSVLKWLFLFVFHLSFLEKW